MKTTREKVSYCIGLETAKNLKVQFADMDLSCLTKGFQDSLDGLSPELSQEEIQQILNALKNQMAAQQRQNFTHVSEENRKRSEIFLTANKSKEGISTLTSGLQYKILSTGSGIGVSPTPLDIVKIHYRGSFIDGSVFDSSYQRGQPAVFPLNRVIAGWSEALQKMKIGDKWQIFIPPYLAYGEMGFGQEIGPNTALIFEIELLAINET